MLQQKVLRISQRNKQHQKELQRLLSDGWVIKSSTSQSQGYNAGKTCCLGGLFLPLALLGRKDNITEYILEKEVIPPDQLPENKQVEKEQPKSEPLKEEKPQEKKIIKPKIKKTITKKSKTKKVNIKTK